VALYPRYADAYNNLGIALVRVGLDREAIAAYGKAIEIEPRHANAYFNLGKLSARLNELTTAISLFEMAIVFEPNHAYAYHELGAAQEKCGQLEQAAASYRWSMRLDPTRTVRENLASLLALMGEPAGIEMLEELVRETPDEPESHWNLGIGLLLHGRFTDGWKEFEWRTEIPRFYKQHHRFEQPRWQGEPLDGKTILLFGEQGHGDTLQFLRYIPFVAERGGRIVLEVPPLLRGLLQGFPGVELCIGIGDDKPEFSTYASLMSLPFLLGAEAIPPPIAPLVPERSRANAWQSGDLKVGLSWAGSPKNMRDRLRSIPLAHLNPLAVMDGVAFTSLQMGPMSMESVESQHSFCFVEDCANLPDFAELAAVVAQQDLIITVDTAVAHLAGSMGKPVWILLNNAVDWRWGLHTALTDWYPNARLFRQNKYADWSGVVEMVRQELEAIKRNKSTLSLVA
jgi:tetratricopeptide (TPR) repeat protein